MRYTITEVMITVYLHIIQSHVNMLSFNLLLLHSLIYGAGKTYVITCIIQYKVHLTQIDQCSPIANYLFPVSFLAANNTMRCLQKVLALYSITNANKNKCATNLSAERQMCLSISHLNTEIHLPLSVL